MLLKSFRAFRGGLQRLPGLHPRTKVVKSRSKTLQKPLAIYMKRKAEHLRPPQNCGHEIIPKWHAAAYGGS